VEKRVAIEVDGGQHNDAEARDRRRDRWLEQQGFVILRFWNHEVLSQIDSVKEVIWRALNETPSIFLPRGRGRKHKGAINSPSA
jgi:adenine-specific DNA-methyltransferase